MLGEPCQQCGGFKVRYHGKVYCTGHEDLSSCRSAEKVSIDMVLAEMREVLLSKLNKVRLLLGQEKDPARQEQLVSSDVQVLRPAAEAFSEVAQSLNLKPVLFVLLVA